MSHDDDAITAALVDAFVTRALPALDVQGIHLGTVGHSNGLA